MLCDLFGDVSEVSTLKSACFSSLVLKLIFHIRYGQPIALVDPVAIFWPLWVSVHSWNTLIHIHANNFLSIFQMTWIISVSDNIHFIMKSNDYILKANKHPLFFILEKFQCVWNPSLKSFYINIILCYWNIAS